MPLPFTETGLSPVLTSVMHAASLNRWKVIVPPAAAVAPVRCPVSLIDGPLAVAVVVSLGCPTDGQLAVLEVAVAKPPPTPAIVAVTVSIPPFAAVVNIAE